MLFPTSVIGSLPRPRFVKDLIADDSPLPEAEYRRLMGEAIRSAVALQEMAGLDASAKEGRCRRIRYRSDGLSVVGFVLEPPRATPSPAPAILVARGGNRDQAGWALLGYDDRHSAGIGLQMVLSGSSERR